MRNQLYILFLLTVFCKLDLTSLDCQIYLNKFDDMEFENSVAFNAKQEEFNFTIGYFDPLFTNEKFYGLTIEDGKPINSVCLDLRILLFSSSSYNDLIYLKDQSLKSSKNQTSQYRYLSFIVKEEVLNQYIHYTTNNTYLLRIFYAQVYQLNDEIYYIHKSEFSLSFFYTVTSQISVPELTVKLQTQMNFCDDRKCSKSIIPNYTLTEDIYIRQTIITPLFSYFYLIDTEVYFIGKGLNKKGYIEQVNNSVQGETIIKFKASIAWNNVSIKVNSILLENFKAARFLEQCDIDQQNNNPVLIIQVIFDSIKQADQNRCKYQLQPLMSIT